MADHQTILSQALILARRGAGAELQQQLDQLVVRARSEQGCLAYELLHDAQRPELWQLRGLWHSPQALQLHLQQPHLQVLGQLTGRGLIRQLSLSSSPWRVAGTL
ncbi:hypothetical protein A9179_16245 [Pseudomonas alcaligenes]|uniref:ABM domain-containing protein n=1 Tax=Aquipseudomonas alcaligenes TaxID=43263 RepID=A0ABR7S522_AQUAC|nr:antibiotic biosynthesis monooxygenase [Pseudomonas alcaligenes]MBC9251822.1 hypothetical protein [Pseudomonas alcaligenes]